MVPILRMIGFMISAIGLQIATGIGLGALVLSALLGWFRAGFFWILVPTIGGAVAADYLFADISTGGKVINSASNLAFELIVYLIISAVGYTVGALARRWRWIGLQPPSET
jgi:signal transduction histidine kinase